MENGIIEPLENLENKSSHGGPREGSGRPKGKPNAETLERMAVEKAVKQRILKIADKLITAQISLAMGVTSLWRIDKDDKGHNQKPVMVTDQNEIEQYLADEFGEDNESYYFLATQKPDNKALDSLLDRGIGKAVIRMSGADEDGNHEPLIIRIVHANRDDSSIPEKLPEQS